MNILIGQFCAKWLPSDPLSIPLTVLSTLHILPIHQLLTSTIDSALYPRADLL